MSMLELLRWVWARDGGAPARRAVIRWGLRLFRREWRQQLLVFGLLTVAVAAMVMGSAVATAAPGRPGEATFGTATAMITLPGSDPRLAADIAAITRRHGAVNVIENENLSTGTTQNVQLRAEDPRAVFGSPMLTLVSGRYPAALGQVALTDAVAALYGVRRGGVVRLAGRSYRVTGIVQNPSNLLDEFALVEPGQVTGPTQVSILLDARRGGIAGLPSEAAVSYPGTGTSGISPAMIALAAFVLGLVFIGLVTVAGFTVMAQRRLRALGMLSSLGATGRNIQLVMVANGAAVGTAAVIAGAIVGFGAWLAYIPRLQAATGHVIDPLALPWWVIITGMALAVITAMLAARQPARTAARVPVVAALSGHPPRAKAVHRSARAGLTTLAAGLVLLLLSGASGGGGPGSRLIGLIATSAGMCLLAGICVTVVGGAAPPRLPVAVRIALRDLARYRARSGAALAAVSFAVFLAMAITLGASFRFSMALDWTGENLTSSQLIVYTSAYGGGADARPTGGPQGQTAHNQRQAGVRALHPEVTTLASQLRAQGVIPLYTAVSAHPDSGSGTSATLVQVGTVRDNFSGTVYVATPALLARYGIRQNEIGASTDILTMRPGLASEPDMQLTSCFTPPVSGYMCPAATSISDPVMQTFGSLPSGTSAPNTVLTMHAVQAMHGRMLLSGWLVQAPKPLTAVQISSARSAVAAAGGTLETKSGQLGLSQIADGATAAGILIALGVLAMSVGLIRSESAGDLRTLAAAGASRRTRRAITSATAGALALLGAALGSAVAFAAIVAWAPTNLGGTFAHVPWADVLLILAGLPVAAGVAGWLFAGRQPSLISRQPLE
ncbi:MAG TPA: FtsX-like permease family protein [Streptosporangiaceae bacterium]|nr:FtsX-like permease family protein [Streptosporangiaceae bacterium]